MILHIDSWLETMRRPGGYGGPVTHWWEDCLDFCGAGLDWRYEGILAGYLSLWRATGQAAWLEKAARAGDDLVCGQLPSGNFRNSCFELNPNTGGTPHEAAADIGLLNLATTLRSQGDDRWQRYFQAAEKNLTCFYLAVLWDPAARSFRDAPEVPSFVPNKSATLVEALLLYAELAEREDVVERYALPTLETILSHQAADGALSGAICQNSFGGRKVEAYFPYYNARCIPGLVAGYEACQERRYLEAGLAAGRWVLQQRYGDGSFPQVVYPAGRANRFPQWVAAVGDILRAWALLARYGFEYDPQPTLDWLLAGQLPDGSFRSGTGFGRAGLFSRQDGRDDLAAAGWVDKAFRYFTDRLEREALELQRSDHA